MADTSPLRPRSSQRYRATCGLSLRRALRADPRSVRTRSGPRLRNNVDVRKVLIRLGAALAVVLVVAVGGRLRHHGVYAEYRLARSVRAAARLNWDPSVAILGFPVHPAGDAPALQRGGDQGQRRRASAGRQGITGGHDALDRPHRLVVVDRARCEACRSASWRAASSSTPRIWAATWASPTCWSRRRPGRPTTPPAVTTESGISDSHGLVFTGTPKAADFDKRVSVSVDLSMTGADRTTLVFTPTGVLTGPAPPTRRCPTTRGRPCSHAFRASPARPAAALRGRADQPGRPGLRRDHRGHHRGSNHHPRRVQAVMSTSLGRGDRRPGRCDRRLARSSAGC